MFQIRVHSIYLCSVIFPSRFTPHKLSVIFNFSWTLHKLQVYKKNSFESKPLYCIRGFSENTKCFNFIWFHLVCFNSSAVLISFKLVAKERKYTFTMVSNWYQISTKIHNNIDLSLNCLSIRSSKLSEFRHGSGALLYKSSYRKS